jgi:hypothetical protein
MSTENLNKICQIYQDKEYAFSGIAAKWPGGDNGEATSYMDVNTLSKLYLFT